MKLLRSVVFVVAVVAMFVSFSLVSFAAEKMQHKNWQQACQAKIKVLKDSAAVLQKTNPDLAKGLTNLAAQKEKQLQEMMAMKAKQEANRKLLRDSAAALQKTNPDLANDLWNMSEQKHMKKGMMKKKGCSSGMMMKYEEKEEAEEATE